MASWSCQKCYHQFTFVPPLGEEGKSFPTRPPKCPNCGVLDSGTDGDLDACEG